MTQSAPRNTPQGFLDAAGELRRLDSVARTSRFKVTAAELDGLDVLHFSIPNVQATGTGVVESGDTIDSDKWLVSEPVVLVSKLNPRKGTVAIADPAGQLAVASSEFVPLTTDDPDDDRFLFYVASSAVVAAHLAAMTTSVTNSHQRVAPSDIRTLGIPWPARLARAAIADFLDREIAQIDEMIKAQLELIAVLRSRRTAEVVAAVRLQQDADDLPAGWELLPFKYVIASRFTGEWGGEPGSDDVDVSCVRVADFHRAHRRAGTAIPTTRSVSADKACAKALRPGDLLVERSGGTAKNPVGTVVLYDGPEGAISSNFIECVRLRDEHDPAFWCYLQEAAYSTGFTQVFVRQTSGIQNLDAQEFYREYFAAPGLAEQRRIAAALDQQTAQLAEMIDAANDVVSLLRERREALITAAVTGGIDPGTGIETVEETP
ncbi:MULTISPECIES: hypothetical protein [unclassified Modestobacter]